MPKTRRRPRLALPALAAAVALLHLGLWQGMADSFAASPAPERSTASVTVRTLAPLPPVAPAPQETAAPAPTRSLPQRPRAAPAATPPAAEAAAPQAEPEAAAEPVQLAARMPAEIELTPVADTSAKGEPTPVYRTKMPPPITLHYDMRQGAFSGTGELQWRPTAQGYEARMQGKVAGFNILTWVSTGVFDAAGIAPVRYTDQRRNKAALAANFQREAGKITYSGDSAVFALTPGTQDRMSWMIQIAAIAGADPKRLAPGAQVAMFVSGARGDADVWTFTVSGTEEITIDGKRVPTLKLHREPRKPRDTKVEAWLAPSLHYLPAKARLSSEDSALELNLRRSEPGS